MADSPLIDRSFVELGMLTHVENWLPYYLARVERLKGIAAQTLPQPKSWRVTNKFGRRPEDSMPFVDVVSSGTSPAKPFVRDGDGLVRGWWLVAVGAAVSARVQQDAKNLAGYYAAAIRGLVLEMPSLGGWSYGCVCSAEQYDDFPVTVERTIATCRLVFTVEVHDVMSVFGGPPDSTTPPDDPYAIPPDQPTVQHPPEVTFTLEAES